MSQARHILRELVHGHDALLVNAIPGETIDTAPLPAAPTAPEFWVNRGWYTFWLTSLFFMGGLICIPSLISTRPLISAYGAVGGWSLALAGMMIGLTLDRHGTTRRNPKNRQLYFLISRSAPNAILLAALISTLFTGWVFGYFIYDMAFTCDTATGKNADTLGLLIYNDTTLACNSTLIDLNRRLPFYSHSLALILMCLDDLAITIAFASALGLLFLVNIGVVVHSALMKRFSESVSMEAGGGASVGLSMIQGSSRLPILHPRGLDDDEDKLIPFM